MAPFDRTREESLPPMSDALDLLARRQSIPSRQLGEPGPDAETLETLLTVGIRVPDHGRLVPWRLIVTEGDDKLEMGKRLADLAARKHPEFSQLKLDKENKRYTFAPLVIIVVARIDPENRIPVQEQLFSGGCVAHNLLLAAQALGFGAQWLTGWAAYDREAASIFGLEDDEQVVGFIHVGTPQREIPDHKRPALADVTSRWTA